MKVHKMSTKQFAKFVSGLQEQAVKNPLKKSYKFTDKYDYECEEVRCRLDEDWRIRRKLGGTDQFKLWAVHNPWYSVWTVIEGDKVYGYHDTDLEKAVQKDG